jgi:hypothetical protein
MKGTWSGGGEGRAGQPMNLGALNRLNGRNGAAKGA